MSQVQLPWDLQPIREADTSSKAPEKSPFPQEDSHNRVQGSCKDLQLVEAANEKRDCLVKTF
jgi:hypothetical protein